MANEAAKEQEIAKWKLESPSSCDERTVKQRAKTIEYIKARGLKRAPAARKIQR